MLFQSEELLIRAETEAEIAEDTRVEAQELELIIQQQHNAIQGTSYFTISNMSFMSVIV